MFTYLITVDNKYSTLLKRGIENINIIRNTLHWHLVLSCLRPSSLRGLAARWAKSPHLSLSSTLLSKSTTGRFVHVAMLFIHVVRCPPLLIIDPGDVPCMISFSRLSPCFRITWPWNDNIDIMLVCFVNVYRQCIHLHLTLMLVEKQSETVDEPTVLKSYESEFQASNVRLNEI